MNNNNYLDLLKKINLNQKGGNRAPNFLELKNTNLFYNILII